MTGGQHGPQASVRPAFEEATVVDAMRVGVATCPPDASLREVARMMTTYRIHCVLVSDVEGHKPWGVVSDLDVAAAAGANIDELTAGEVARKDVVTVAVDDTMTLAAQLMAEREAAHLVVVQPHSGHPVGVLSTLDVAAALALGVPAHAGPPRRYAEADLPASAPRAHG
jgi:CBS domain-containing protein